MKAARIARACPSLALMGLTAFFSGCVGATSEVAYVKDQAPIPNLVAILPPANQTSDGAAPDTLRMAVAQLALSLGMVPVVSPAQDAQLYEKGFLNISSMTLTEAKAAEIAAALGVDGLIYTTVTSFSDLDIGIYMQQLVGATLKLVDGKGSKIWKISGEAHNRQVNINPTSIASAAGQKMAVNTAVRVAGKALMQRGKSGILERLSRSLDINNGLYMESLMMTGSMIPKLPEWPVASDADENTAMTPLTRKGAFRNKKRLHHHRRHLETPPLETPPQEE